MTLIPVNEVLAEMPIELMDDIVDLRRQGYDIPEIAFKTGASPNQVRYAIRRQRYETREPGPDDIIDGERLADRIKRVTTQIKNGQLFIASRKGQIAVVERAPLKKNRNYSHFFGQK